MTVSKQVHLQYAKEPLQIPYPPNFAGAKTKDDVGEIFISSQPRLLTSDEIEVVESYISKLPYRQQLVLTGLVMIDQNDPLLEYDHSQLDELEKQHSVSNTRYVPGSGERSPHERVLILRELGISSNAIFSIPPGN